MIVKTFLNNYTFSFTEEDFKSESGKVFYALVEKNYSNFYTFKALNGYGVYCKGEIWGGSPIKKTFGGSVIDLVNDNELTTDLANIIISKAQASIYTTPLLVSDRQYVSKFIPQLFGNATLEGRNLGVVVGVEGVYNFIQAEKRQIAFKGMVYIK